MFCSETLHASSPCHPVQRHQRIVACSMCCCTQWRPFSQSPFIGNAIPPIGVHLTCLKRIDPPSSCAQANDPDSRAIATRIRAFLHDNQVHVV